MLSQIIIQKIKNEGPLSFHDFMEMALYYPELGYYTSARDKIGKNGDYYTSSCITSTFGALLGCQIEEMWQLSGDKEFTIVEYGAGEGFLAHDILNYMKHNTKLYNHLNYCIIEKSDAMREKAKRHLPSRVQWFNSINDIAGVVGCVLSNELVDNFSVHKVVMKEELMEIFVDYNTDFVEVLRPASSILKNYMTELNVVLPKDFRTEINIEATEWIKDIATCLHKGYVITIDYGYLSSELYADYRKKGTLICYKHHKINAHPYHYIGEQDITTHVNFSALHHWGVKYGLDCCGLTDQAHFLLALGFKDYLKKMQAPGQDVKNYQTELFLTNTLIMDMGNKFKILLQKKGLPDYELTGLKN